MTQASVAIGNSEKASIRNGMMILVGIEHDDLAEDVEWLLQKGPCDTYEGNFGERPVGDIKKIVASSIPLPCLLLPVY